MQRLDLVVDVGNTRIKWGLCGPGAIVAAVSLPPDDPVAWQAQLERWHREDRLCWAVAGVHPPRCESLVHWARQRGDVVEVVHTGQQLPLRVLLGEPEKVGIDRLLDAVAVNHQRSSGAPAVVIDAGSAVTVDYLDECGAFRGGAIMPGFRLMATALHDYTALLPMVEVREPHPALPGLSTRGAMQAGVFWAVAGGVRAVVGEMAARCATSPEVFLTGGDGPLLLPVLSGARHWPNLTLEGIRLTAEALS
jgi:type III pantothenate kinase